MEGIVLVGGQGTRLRPLTVTTPKPLLPVAGRPFLLHQLDRLRVAGVDHVLLATSYRADAFNDVQHDGLELVTEDEPMGTGGGIRNVANRLRCGGDDPVVVLNGDVLSEHDISAQVAAHEQANAAVTLHLTEVTDARAFGSVPTDNDGRVTAFNEKSESPVTNQINAGCYVFRRSVIDAIPSGRPVSVERETFPGLLSGGARLQGYLESAYWLDIGTPAAYVQACRDLAARSGAALVHPAAEVAPDAVLCNGATVGAGAVVSAGALVDGSVLMPGARIDVGARVVDSAVGRDARIGAEAVLGAAVIGDRAVVGARNELLHGARIWPDVQLPDVAVRFSSDV